MIVTIQFYGAFQKFGKELALELSGPVTLAELKDLLSSSLGGQHRSLIEASAFASEETIINRASVIQTDCRLSILPPVCGG
ncbi:MAG: MoaD/ThiS family protein [Alphaproteobacteria bacterium]|nr:MoaD/ThiS family protein [Alphaproteobacteria bacterium]